MAVLPDADRRAVWAELMQELSSDRDPVAITKGDLLAAVVAVDTWVNNNAAGLNSAIPQPARNQLTAAQKARILTMVVRTRYVKGV